jgi:hypothetical protein
MYPKRENISVNYDFLASKQLCFDCHLDLFFLKGLKGGKPFIYLPDVDELE